MPNTITNYQQGKRFLQAHAIAQLLRQVRQPQIITYWAVDGHVWIETDIDPTHPSTAYNLRKTNITSIDFVRYNN